MGSKELIKRLKEEGWLKTPRIIKAFQQIDRSIFLPDELKRFAWVDEPLPIGRGQTISAPHMVARMTELLRPGRQDKVLEVGAGSGYQAAILSKLVKEVITIELEPELAKRARENLKKAGCRNVRVLQGDGSKGYPEEAPYDKIIVTCACPEIPEELVRQLKEGGRIVIPVGGPGYQVLTLGIKEKGKLRLERYGACVFVPLRH
ncbi:MAG: protein-L-isoaspartate O-methyltransferase [Candidatus Aenigmatarchaeota archaeon]|nr:MAG: protein-L-isoaspartate O-methyltransferase [Candidatus Aenigmarchaeota archaeon]